MSLRNPSYTHNDIRAMLLNECPVFKWNTNDENTLLIDVCCFAIVLAC